MKHSPVASGMRSTGRPPQLITLAIGLLAVDFAVRTAEVISQQWREPNYAMSISAVAISAFGALLTVAGAYAAARDATGLRPWLTVLTALPFLWGFLTMFSIGLGPLLAAIAALVLRLRLVDHTDPYAGGTFWSGRGSFFPSVSSVSAHCPSAGRSSSACPEARRAAFRYVPSSGLPAAAARPAAVGALGPPHKLSGGSPSETPPTRTPARADV